MNLQETDTKPSVFTRIRQGWMSLPFFIDLAIATGLYVVSLGGALRLLAMLFSALAGYKVVGIFTKELGFKIAGAVLVYWLLATFFTGITLN